MTPASSQASSLAESILPQIKRSDSPQKLTHDYKDHRIHIIAESPPSDRGDSAAGTLTFLVVTNGSSLRQAPFDYLDKVRKRFFEEFPESSNFPEMPHYGAGSFNVELRNLMVEAGQNDAFSNAKREINDATEIMTANIDTIVARGENLNLLVHKTSDLNSTSRDFRFRSRGLSRRMWWENKRWTLILIVVACALLGIIFGIVKAAAP
ncbi:Synaptobrevin [Metarhizium album ARSEF 1941]|uniref:Synaptobrevin homolog YKT6 n=1 Tax=Metarhizium album (strain ARSEF 1941) TaxID=1081103 RepID=A0A0B2WJK7_METAS|nr:Synaptobrevin [Metarhizium album ARSEF 1941]KHN96211.1 Synaptobrevin [Metarhizium album ARSEF 1941]